MPLDSDGILAWTSSQVFIYRAGWRPKQRLVRWFCDEYVVSWFWEATLVQKKERTRKSVVLNTSVALYSRPPTHKYYCVINVLLINCGEMRARSSDEQKSHSLTGTLVEQKHEVRLNWTGLRNLLVGGHYLILRTWNMTTWASFQLAQVCNVPNDWAAWRAVPYCTFKVVKNALTMCSAGHHIDSNNPKSIHKSLDWSF